MNFNNFTIKSQEIVQKAIELTRENGQQQIEPAHLFKALHAEAETIVNYIFQKCGVVVQPVIVRIDHLIDSYPKVSGGNVMSSRDSNEALQRALEYINTQK